MRIAHLSIMRELHKGIEAQLNIEDIASRSLGDDVWDVYAIHDGPPSTRFSMRPPAFLRFMFLRNIYGWIFALKLSRRYDYVLMRHMTFDPFSIVFSWMMKNRIAVHHSKEIFELKVIAPGWKGECASLVERIFARFAVSNAFAIAGVTSEIAKFETAQYSPNKPTLVYPNGVEESHFDVLEDGRSSEGVEAIFISSRFAAWHGLDRLVDAVNRCEDEKALRELTIHIIGELSPEQDDALKQANARIPVFKVHGPLSHARYRSSIMANCHVGIASLAMDVNRLREGSTLKVREMLASGLAVYSSHIDSSFDESFPYYVHDEEVSIPNLIRHARRMSAHSRGEIAREAMKLIAKRRIMEAFILRLRGLAGRT